MQQAIDFFLSKNSKPNFQNFVKWRHAQGISVALALLVVLLLLTWPAVGLTLFWDFLVPLGPLVLVISTGVWRNICPLGTATLLPRHLDKSSRIKLTKQQAGRFSLLGIFMLLLFVPLRHGLFNVSGFATAALIVSLAGAGYLLGRKYEWKSAWCSGMCPILPVEKMYGQKSDLELPNAHCIQCNRCVAPCPDSTAAISPRTGKRTNYHEISGFLMAGAFPGFVWGWFQVPDTQGIAEFTSMIKLYNWPVIGIAISSFLFFFITRLMNEKYVVSLFAAIAVAIYYWFRVPALLGYGVFPGDGMLLDLSAWMPEFIPQALGAGLGLFCIYWLLIKKRKSRVSWLKRPKHVDN